MQFFAMSYLYWLIYEQSHLYNQNMSSFCMYTAPKSLQKTPVWIIMRTLLEKCRVSGNYNRILTIAAGADTQLASDLIPSQFHDYVVHNESRGKRFVRDV